MSQQQGFYISATKKSSGKTVISLGLGAALSAMGHRVQSYKKGPDYIDPMWHQAATGQPCFNLDFFTQSQAEIQHTFDTNRADADIVYIEGNKGLFDGIDTLGSDCNAALAKQLNLPVVLIVNAQGITRGIAPLIKGYEAFADEIEYNGVIINEIAGARHQAKLIAAIEMYTDMQVLGTVPKASKLHLEERHLGLIPQNEANFSQGYIKQTAALVKANVDIEKLLGRAATFDAPSAPSIEIQKPKNYLKIGIAKDSAFGFYYPDDLQTMQDLGAELVYFDAIKDQSLPDVDALFIGGGFPETQLAELNNNSAMRAQIKQFILADKPVYAECGGLMYLCQEIAYQSETAEMVGVIDANISMTPKPIGRGYAKIKATEQHLWGKMPTSALKCHEFHYSKLAGKAASDHMAYEIKRGYGTNGQADGIMVNNTLANYCHQRHTQNNPWVKHFLDFVQRCTHD